MGAWRLCSACASICPVEAVFPLRGSRSHLSSASSLQGVSQRLGEDAFGQLSHDVRSALVSGAPGIDDGSLCSVLGLACRIVGADLRGSELDCTDTSFRATLFGMRCTFTRL